MPAAAVGAAVFAGVEIATVGIAAMSAFGVIAAVGAIAAGVGVITGNESLVKIGGIMGLVGGVGSLATSSGAISSIDSVNGADISQAGNLSGSEIISAQQGDLGVINQAKITNVGSDVYTGPQNAAPGAVPEAPVAPATVEAAPQVADATVEAAGNGKLVNQGPINADGKGIINGGDESVFTGPMKDGSAAKSGGITKFLSESGDSLWSGFKGMDGASKLAAGKFAADFLGGFTDKTKPAQIAALEARAEYERAQTAALNQSSANLALAQRIPVATGGYGVPGGVFRNGAAPTYGQVNVNRGLINGGVPA